MSIPVLTQVYDEVRRLAIAGSVVAAGDFRLKKLIPLLEQAGQKAPVFAKVGQAVTKLVESDEPSSAGALLELSTLVNAILYTQGETGLAGELVPIETTDLGQQQTLVSARLLKPLLEALSTTGSGRLEVIKDAYERGAFRDLRLVGPALAALDDPYPEIAEFVAGNVLPMYGTAIVAELRDKFDLKRRGGHVHRLILMHRLDPEGSRETVQGALDEGSKEVRIAAIECLGSSREDLPLLLEHAKSKNKEVRSAALWALGKSDADEAAQALCAAVGGNDLGLAVGSVRDSRNPQVLKFVLGQAKAEFTALLAGKQKDKAKQGGQVGRMLLILECLRGRDDVGTEEFLLHAFGQRAQLAAVKANPSGKDVQERLVSIMAAGSQRAQDALIDAHTSLPAVQLAEAFVAACRSRKPAEVFELFSPYLAADAKKKRDSASAKRELIAAAIAGGKTRGRYTFPLGGGQDLGDLAERLDPRWLDLAVRQQHLPMLLALARPGHEGANQLLSESFQAQLKKSKYATHEVEPILQAMVRVQHPGASEAVMAAIAKYAKAADAYSLPWIARHVPSLPKEALPKLEALLPTLPEKAIDQVLDFVTQLKNRELHAQEITA